MNDMINDMMEDYDLLVAEADATTLRDWVRQALYIMHSETVEAVVERIKSEIPKLKNWGTVCKDNGSKCSPTIWASDVDNIIHSLRTELLSNDKDV